MSLRLNPAWLLVTVLAPASVSVIAAPPIAAPVHPASAPIVTTSSATTSPAASGQALGKSGLPANRSGLNAQQLHQQIQNNTARLEQLEQANQEALARNQELQLMNDNLSVQVQVLQSERSAQMFLYGAATLVVGALMGFILANYILSRRPRRW